MGAGVGVGVSVIVGVIEGVTVTEGVGKNARPPIFELSLEFISFLYEGYPIKDEVKSF